MTSSLRDQLQADLSSAIRARDARRMSVLRTTLAALANAEAVDVSSASPGIGPFATDVDRRLLTEHDALVLVTHARDELRTAAREMARLGQDDAATDLDAQAVILDGYLAARRTDGSSAI